MFIIYRAQDLLNKVQIINKLYLINTLVGFSIDIAAKILRHRQGNLEIQNFEKNIHMFIRNCSDFWNKGIHEILQFKVKQIFHKVIIKFLKKELHKIKE